MDHDPRTAPAPSITWTAFDAARVRATEDRLRIETNTPNRWPLRRSWTALGRRTGDPPPIAGPRPCADREAASAGPLTIAICIAAPLDRIAARWGDWHFAAAMARALERNGHLVHVLTREHWWPQPYVPCDLQIVLRGLHRVPRAPNAAQVLWIISHPECVEPAECDEADLILVASERFAQHLDDQTTSPVAVVLQATDHHRFRPVTPVVRHDHDVLVVAKTRDVARPIVMDAIAAGLRPAIYGTGWSRLVDRSLIAGEYLRNRELPVVYSSAGVLLSDQWESMRTWGFVTNRIFDSLACRTPVISNAAPPPELLGDVVPAYRTPLELGELVAHDLTNPGEARSRADEGRQRVLAAHTFDHRARQLLELARSHGLASSTDSR